MSLTIPWTFNFRFGLMSSVKSLVVVCDSLSVSKNLNVDPQCGHNKSNSVLPSSRSYIEKTKRFDSCLLK